MIRLSPKRVINEPGDRVEVSFAWPRAISKFFELMDENGNVYWVWTIYAFPYKLSIVIFTAPTMALIDREFFKLHGSLRQKGRKEIFESVRECPDDARKAILATGSYIGEGFDEPRLDTLFLTMPSSFKGKIVPYAGRLHRYHKDKKDIRIYDYVDKCVSVLERMFNRRLKTYKSLGYDIRAEDHDIFKTKVDRA